MTNKKFTRAIQGDNISTPHSNSLPIGREDKNSHNPLNYAIAGRIWIIRDVGKLIVFLHLTGLVRIRSLIALPKIQPE